MLGDVVAVARHRVGGGRGPGESAYADLPVLTMGDALTRYHISLDVADRPGVLAQVATAFAEHGVRIETVRQQVVRDEGDGGPRQPHRRDPHRARRRAVGHRSTRCALLVDVDEVTSVMRVEGPEWPTCGAA